MTQAGRNPVPLTPGMGSVGSITPVRASSSSSDLDFLTGASGVGRGRPRSSPDSRTASPGSCSVSDGVRMETSAVSDQENQMPIR